MKQKFSVSGMTCSACSAHIEKAVGKLPGVTSAQVSLLANSMTVEYDAGNLNADAIVKAVDQAGYGATLVEAGNTAKTEQPKALPSMDGELKSMKHRVIWSFIFLIPLFYISMGHMMGLPLPMFLHSGHNALTFAMTQFLLTLPILYLNDKYFKVGFKTLFRGSPNMDSLIAIGSAAAVGYGIFALFQIGIGYQSGNTALVDRYSMDLYFESAGMILTLITLGKFLETRSKGKTSQAISKLIDLAPKTATVERDGIETEIPVEEVVVGDILLVRPGQSIPVDGVIVEGSSSIDESALTGESIPVAKQVDDRVIAASINKAGFFKFRATKVGSDTTLAQIIRLVEEAGASKAPIAKLADKVSGIFVPVVIGIALVTFVVWMVLGYGFAFALSAAIAVLVISCPCALGLATPVAIMVGTGKGAEHGILIKSAQALETAHTIKTVVLDKTGTITEGKPRVTDLVAANGISEETLLEIAAALEKPSEHPLAEAILEEAASRQISLKPVEQFTAVIGKGVSAKLGGERYFAGNLNLMRENAITLADFEEKGVAFADDGKTPLYFANDKQVIGLIAVADVVKPTSRQAIDELKSMGIQVVMLTGDNKRTAAAIQRQLNIDKVIAEVMPQDKEREVAALQESGHKVAMIGDGINDAPALTRADVGIAIGAGTDIAIESADVVLMKSDLLDAVTAIQLSRATIRNIKQNLFWAFFYNTIGIPLAAGVFFPMLGWLLNPMFAAAAMSLSSVCVVSNALRLKLFRPKFGGELQQEQFEKTPETTGVMIENPKTQVKQEETNMTKEITIEGMTCSHCTARVEKVLNAIDGVTAVVNLEKKNAIITLQHPVEDAVLAMAITDAGYEVVEIK